VSMERALIALAYDLHLTPHQVGAMYWPEVRALLEFKADRARQQSGASGNILDMNSDAAAASLVGP